MLKGSIVVLKGVRQNNLHYLNGNTVTGKIVNSEGAEDDSIRLWHMRLDT